VLAPVKPGSHHKYEKLPKKDASDRFSGPVRPVFACGKMPVSRIGTYFRASLCLSVSKRDCDMLVERGLQVMNVESVGEAYAIASNYLRKSGAIADTLATNERLLGIIVQMFQRGEYNKIRLANKAIAQFEAETLID
jgi:hypothetical protein